METCTSCDALCLSNCTSSCGSGCASSAMSVTMHDRIDRVTNDFMLDIIQNILRYVILLGNKNDIVTSLNSILSVTVDPVDYVVNITYDNGVTVNDKLDLHRFENVFRISRVNNDITLTKKEYRQVFDLYSTDTTETVGTKTITHNAGSRIVKSYALYPDTEYVNVRYMFDNVHQVLTIEHAAGNPCEKYYYQAGNEYDENHNIIHYDGDVMVDENGQVIFDYVVSEYSYHWDLIREDNYVRPNANDNPNREWTHL